MKRKEWPAWLAAGSVTLSLLLVGCTRDAPERTGGGPSATAPRPAATTDPTRPVAKLATVTLKVTGMT